MPAYAYPINIKREPQKIRYQNEFELESDVLTLAKLRKYVSEDECFSIGKTEESFFQSTYTLYVSGTRLETNEELKTRIEKQEKYMEEYNKRHKNNLKG